MGEHRYDRSNVAAGIVTYNPDAQRLAENIAAIRPQVDRVILVDNGSNNAAERLCPFSDAADIQIIFNDQNAGIAAALNQIMRAAEAGGYHWCVTLDQDSVSPDGMVDAYLNYDQLDDDVGIMFPLRVDRNRPDFMYVHTGDYEVVTSGLGPITSGAMVNLDAWRSVGGFFEPLFIDYVDFEFNARLFRHGYKAVRENQKILVHELGRCEEHMFFGKKVLSTNHSPMRKYYKARNALYYNHIYRNEKAVRQYKWHLCCEMIKIMLYEKNWLRKCVAIVRGMHDSRKFLKTYRDRPI